MFSGFNCHSPAKSCITLSLVQSKGLWWSTISCESVIWQSVLHTHGWFLDLIGLTYPYWPCFKINILIMNISFINGFLDINLRLINIKKLKTVERYLDEGSKSPKYFLTTAQLFSQSPNILERSDVLKSRQWNWDWKGSRGVNIWADCVITNQFIPVKTHESFKKGEAPLSFNSETFLHFKLSFLPTLTQSHFIYFQCFSVL